MTRLPDILAGNGVDHEAFDEALFSLVEMPSPQLCADRLDYALRDAISFGKLTMEDARRVVGSLKAFPSAVAPRRTLVLNDPHLALLLSRAYIGTDKDFTSSPGVVDSYQHDPPESSKLNPRPSELAVGQ